jgi:hypothetical protein
VLLTALSTFAQPPAPQTARQALIDMIKSGDIVSHLPDATQAAIEKSGSSSSMALPLMQLQALNKNMQLFPAGSVLLSITQPTGEKFQVNVDRDDLNGDHDQMELSIHGFKNGEEQPLGGITPRLSLGMMLQRGTWRIQQVGVNIGVRLDDPEFLQSLQRSTVKRAGASDESSALLALHRMRTAEHMYRAQNPSAGYTCSLRDLASVTYPGTSTRVLNPELASGLMNNYSYTLSGCGSRPSPTFVILAVPSQPGQRAFCADQTGALNSATPETAATCMTGGNPVERRSRTQLRLEN